jgi:hypothetical protein
MCLEREKIQGKTVHTRAYAIYNRPHPQHVPCGHMALHPTAAYMVLQLITMSTMFHIPTPTLWLLGIHR